MSNTLKPVQIKLVLLGDHTVGKSSLALRFVNDDFQENKEPTVGAAFLRQKYRFEDKIIQLEIWDTSGQERYHDLAPMYYRNAQAAVVIYDVTKAASLNKAKSWVKELQRQANPNIVIALAGNKIDLVQPIEESEEESVENRRQVPTEEAKLYAYESGLLFFETSAKEGDGIRDVFVEIVKKVPLELMMSPRPRQVVNGGPNSLPGLLKVDESNKTEIKNFSLKLPSKWRVWQHQDPQKNKQNVSPVSSGTIASCTTSTQAELTNLSDEEWIKKKMVEEDIHYFEYSEFSKFIEIGKGGFGIVTKAETNDKKRVALKSLRDSVIDEDVKKNFVRELKLLRMVSYHDNINRFLGITKNNTDYVMVLEYANEGNLRDYLKKKFDSLQWENKIQMALDITRGLKCLHSKNIIHRDLHSKNVLVNNGKLLIADFGLSKKLTEVTSNSMSNGMGIIEYVEPQCLRDVNYVKDKRSDVYSLGVLLWEITSGHPPFHKTEVRNTLIYHIGQGNLREKPIEGTPLKYQQLYQKCWDGDPDKRPDINQIYNEILSQFNVNDEDSLVASNNDSLNSLNIESGQSDLYIDTVELYNK